MNWNRFFNTSVLFLLLSVTSHAQILTPTKWTWQITDSSIKVGDEIDLIFKISIDKDWYVYANEFDPDCGPMHTTVTLTPDASFKTVGTLKAINPKAKHDEIFDCDVKIFEKTAEFRQKIKVRSANLKLSGVYEGQVCTEVEGKCVPFDGEFVFTGIKVAGSGKEKEIKKEEPQLEVVPVTKDTTLKTPSPAGEGVGGGVSPSPLERGQGGGVSPSPLERGQGGGVSPSPLERGQGGGVSPSPLERGQGGEVKGPTLDKTILEGESTFGNDSFWALLILAFVAGLTSLITPCVFPMIPMTVTFFLKDTQTKREGIKKAIIFGLSIIILYSSAGTLFAIILGPEGLNALATNWALNLFIFFVFIIFALSFFGLFEITAPYQLVNKVDRQAEKGGLVGVFFMAFTLVLISFSCTVPIVGSVLALSAGGQILKPILMMFSYSFAFALPFTFFAFFPEMIKSMPKSGGWLNAVKVTLGFLELALALKFFSIADQAYHWGLLDRDVNIALWVVIFTLLGFYLLGKLRLPHDSILEKIPVTRLLIAILVFTFVIYLIPGLWGAPLKALAGYLPPQHTNDFDLVTLTRNIRPNEICDNPQYADFLHLPHGLKGYFDYEQALKCAREQNKPLFIDFTGHGCTNCREMEAVVWSDPAVLERLKNDFVIVALYVDDKTVLPESEWITSRYDGKVKKTIGKKNADIQIANLDNNAQPFYVLLGTDERVLAWPYGYNRNVEEFVKFLESGKKKFKELNGN